MASPPRPLICPRAPRYAASFVLRLTYFVASAHWLRVSAIDCGSWASWVMSTCADSKDLSGTIGRPRNILRASPTLDSSTKMNPSPVLSPLPVLPILWMYCSRLGGSPIWMTWVTLGKSIPRAVTSVENIMADLALRNLSETYVRCACESWPCISETWAGYRGC